MKENLTNIVIVSLNDKYCKNVAANLANLLDMFVADCHEMVVYDLINPKEVLEKCGLEYFKKREKSVINSCSQYYNTVLSINFELFKEYDELFDNSLIIYLKLPENRISKVVNEIDFKNRDNFLIEHSDIIIQQNKCLVQNTVKSILKVMGEIYENI